MAKFFQFPWAISGDRAVIPEAVDPGGAVSYTQGFGPDYEITPGDPGWRPVPRPETNQYLYDVTDNIRQYQLHGAPTWYDASNNGGVAISYEINAIVRHNDLIYRSLVASNIVEPGTDPTKWAEVSAFAVASNAEVQAGVINDRIVTPLNLSSRTATLTRTGLVELSTETEITAGTDADRVASVAVLAPAVRKNSWSFATAGGTADAIAVTLVPAPANLAALVGAELRVLITAANTGPVTLNVNGLGAVAVVANDLQPLSARSFIVDQIVSLVYDGTRFQSDASSGVVAPAPSGSSVEVDVAATSGLFNIMIGQLRSSVGGASCGIDLSFDNGGSWTVLYQDNINAPGENASILLSVSGGSYVALILQTNTVNVQKATGSTGAVTGIRVRARASSGNVNYSQLWIRKSA